jgi:hypothetical protein
MGPQKDGGSEEVDLISRKDISQTLMDGTVKVWVETRYMASDGGGRVLILKPDWSKDRERDAIKAEIKRGRESKVSESIKI